MCVCSATRARLRELGREQKDLAARRARAGAVEKDVDSVDGGEPGFTAFLEDATPGGDASAEEVELLRMLRFKGKRLTAL